MKTVVVNEKSIKREWYVVDAKNKVLGRLASKIAQILVGKNKVAYSPNQDHGDNIIVINSDQIKLTGKKPEIKKYFTHSMYPGGKKETPFKLLMQKDSRKVILHAVKGMIPKNKLGRQIIKKLYIYKDANHPHISQKPKELII
jgi:large subunit ribosomal protein L13